MRIGYASIAIGQAGAQMKTTVQKYATPEKLRGLVAHNLGALDAILEYNAKNDIRLFRISSDIIPFGSSPVNTLPWWDIFKGELAALGHKARSGGMRLSMHPGQYTVLNSPSEEVVTRAVADLAYHTKFLDALGMEQDCKIVLHVGGVYGDRGAATRRFIRVCTGLPAPLRRRLVIENDDKLYTAANVLAICRATGQPMVLDTLHHELNREEESPPLPALLAEAAKTWGRKDGPQKIHYSQQAQGKKPGSHSATIHIVPFMQFYGGLAGHSTDIMLEVKDKNLSAVKCTLCTTQKPHIARLEEEWARYKYSVLEHSAALYGQMRALLRDKTTYPAVAFYTLLEQAVATPVTKGAFCNAAQHVWGYVAKLATPREKQSFTSLLQKYWAGAAGPAAVKTRLHTLAKKYGQTYLLHSYYFIS